jgi:hypothetical protein
MINARRLPCTRVDVPRPARGETQYRVGLSPEWYAGAYLKYLHIVIDAPNPLDSVLAHEFRSPGDMSEPLFAKRGSSPTTGELYALNRDG